MRDHGTTGIGIVQAQMGVSVSFKPRCGYWYRSSPDVGIGIVQAQMGVSVSFKPRWGYRYRSSPDVGIGIGIVQAQMWV